MLPIVHFALMSPMSTGCAGAHGVIQQCRVLKHFSHFALPTLYATVMLDGTIAPF